VGLELESGLYVLTVGLKPELGIEPKFYLFALGFEPEFYAFAMEPRLLLY
jgi:hypothetical protein